jgi:hypothetical protein
VARIETINCSIEPRPVPASLATETVITLGDTRARISCCEVVYEYWRGGCWGPEAVAPPVTLSRLAKLVYGNLYPGR